MREYAAACAVAGGEKQLHIGVAEALRADDVDLALRVLTDLAEAYADDAPIVRIVARFAGGWGRGVVGRGLVVDGLEVWALDATSGRLQGWLSGSMGLP